MSVREDVRKNLEMAGLFKDDSDYDGMIGRAVMKLANCHCDEGHSVLSHEITIRIFNEVINGKALTKEYWDMKKKELTDFAMENMGKPWGESIIEEMIGRRPE